MLIRPINESDNKQIAVILREVLVEMDIPRIGSAFEDPEIDKMYESYQSNRSKYFIVEENNKILGGAGINELKKLEGVGAKKAILIQKHLNGS